ncbi:endodeoxyribonuclease RusA [Paenibacillus dendritiformis C454]|uniref:Endodeoxyribonuclease RusA n=1 Tax=Paenibacillus dendritiformis C454 TaxID=1131935 RepID=H3SBG1_9BACL|nr:RusA family crossover junction endodeoxyribonuclease [Paenibacillus dendritiformis]EHQ63644.1 endodeoxyribonuclease RusA [Paenibacillus dendritiformis C454]
MERLILNGLAPSVNHMYRNARVKNRNMRVLTDVAHAWYEETVLTANVWRRRNRWMTAQGKTIVRLWFFFPDRRKRDTHNALKLLLDALEDAGIYENDQYALPRIMDFEIDRQNPRIEIEFEEMQRDTA